MPCGPAIGLEKCVGSWHLSGLAALGRVKASLDQRRLTSDGYGVGGPLRFRRLQLT